MPEVGPLAGLRVLELATMVAGPYCSKLLAGMGAEVTKVEPPAGDPLRRLGPFAAAPDGEASGTFVALNASKRGITLDPSTETGRALLRDLVARADVVVEDWAPGALADLVGEPLALNPAQVVVSITPFGQSGPRAGWKGGDLVAWAAGGMAHVTGLPDQAPLQAGGLQSFHLAGLQAAAGAMIALLHARRTGEGQRVDVSIEESVASILESTVTDYQLDGSVRGRMGTRHPAAHGVGMQHLADGRWLFVGTCPQVPMWESVKRLMGDPEWARDERWNDYLERRRHADEIDRLANESFSQLTVEETFEPLLAAGVPVGVVNDANQALASEQLRQRGLFEQVEVPGVGAVPVPAAPWPAAQRTPLGPAPRLGEHNEAVFVGELGHGVDDLARWRRAAVV